MLKRFLISVVIASLGVAVYAAPQCGSCTSCSDGKDKAKATKSTKAVKQAAVKPAKKAAAKDDCCHKDPFLMEANRMAAAAEGKKSTGCHCEDKALADKAKADKAKAAKAKVKAKAKKSAKK